jgi:two-component system, NtrC family, sensor histidine kinase PilS
MPESNAQFVEEVERRRHALTLSLLRVYNLYRLLVGFGLLIVHAHDFAGSSVGVFAPELFQRAVLAYCLFNVASVVLLPSIPPRVCSNQRAVSTLVVIDILVLALLMYASGGVDSGIGLLLLVAVAAGAILVTDRRTLMLAALATIATLYQQFYLSLTAPALHVDYFQAGTLGALFFGAAIAFEHLSRRVRDHDIQALTQAAELADLEQINRQIIARMRTGIAVVDGAGRVRMANASARILVGGHADGDVDQLPEALANHLAAWRQNVELRAPPFQIASHLPEIQVNFSPVRKDDPHGDVTVFIEDTSEVQQRAQQLKLAALGRLSASIAHEIRNPLGAISHAAQLLNESPNLDAGDRRLTEIIHRHGQRMNRVVENVLETSRRQLPTPVRLKLTEHLQTFVASFAETFAESFPACAGAACIEIDVQPADVEVRIDSSQLDQVLTNLVSNAIRHSHEQSGRPYARLEGGVDPATGRPYLNVIDRGRGVPEGDLRHLFNPFFTTAPGGTGLGLYVSRELCEANQARLFHSRHPEGGACFRIAFSHPDRIPALHQPVPTPA